MNSITKPNVVRESTNGVRESTNMREKNTSNKIDSSNVD